MRTHAGWGVVLVTLFWVTAQAAELVPSQLAAWLGPQGWQRDCDGPVVSLGKPGAFDDMHLFAPCVAHTEEGFALWYSGSRGDVRGRVFRLGLATSRDGIAFERSDGQVVTSKKKDLRIPLGG